MISKASSYFCAPKGYLNFHGRSHVLGTPGLSIKLSVRACSVKVVPKPSAKSWPAQAAT